MNNETNETRKFAAVCRDALNRNQITVNLMAIFNSIFDIISLGFVLITLYVYWIIPDMRQTQVYVEFFFY